MELYATVLSCVLLPDQVTPYDYERIAFILQNLVGGEQAIKLSPEQVRTCICTIDYMYMLMALVPF